VSDLLHQLRICSLLFLLLHGVDLQLVEFQSLIEFFDLSCFCLINEFLARGFFFGPENVEPIEDKAVFVLSQFRLYIVDKRLFL